MTTQRPGDETDSRVDDYIDALPDWQQAICRRLRELIHAADPELAEAVKRSVQPYFVLKGDVCALLAAKDHVICSSRRRDRAGPRGIINARRENKTRG